MMWFSITLLWLVASQAVMAFRCALSHVPGSISEHILSEKTTLFFFSPFQKRYFSPFNIHVLKALSSITASVMTLLFGMMVLISSHQMLEEEHYVTYALVLILWPLCYCGLKGIIELFSERYGKQALRASACITSAFLYPVASIFYPLLQMHKNYCLKANEDGTGKHQMEEILEAMEENSPTNVPSSDYELVRSALSLKDTKVREVMVPRINLFCLEAATTLSEAARLCQEEGYSRVPVYNQDIDHIIGILLVKDLIEVIAHAGDSISKEELSRPIETLVKKVLYVPESKKISQLLQEFRTKHMHLAIVVDEYGGTKGVVTIEDILEEIVGEIEDEYDEEEKEFVEVPSGGWIVSATMSIIDIEDKLGIEIPSHGEYDTIGGYVFHHSGMIPKKGFKIQSDDYTLEVLSSDDRKVERVKITPTAKS